MATNNEQIQAMIAKATAKIPANPEIQAQIAGAQVAAQSAAPAQQEPLPSAGSEAVVEDYSSILDDFDDIIAPGPQAPTRQVQPQRQDDEPLYVPPTQRTLENQDAQAQSLQPQPIEPNQLEAAIEQPLREEELRLTAEEWARRTQVSQPQVQQPQAPTAPQMDYNQLEEQAINSLMQSDYALSDKDKEALIAEPDTVLPRLAAQMHVRMSVQLARQFQQMLPSIIDNHIQGAMRVQRTEQEFYGKYPALNRPEFRETVNQSLGMVKQMTPGATKDEIFRDGAALAAVRLRVRMNEQQTVPQHLPDLPRPTGRAPIQQPFSPAQAGGGTEPVVPTDPNEGNIFAALALDTDW